MFDGRMVESLMERSICFIIYVLEYFVASFRITDDLSLESSIEVLELVVLLLSEGRFWSSIKLIIIGCN